MSKARAVPNFKDIDSISVDLSQPIVFGDGSDDARAALQSLFRTICQNDIEGFKSTIQNPWMKDIHKNRPGPFVLRNSEQFMMTQQISLAAFLGFYNRIDMAEIYAEKLDAQSREMFMKDVLFGAMYSKKSQPITKHIIREYKPSMDRFFPDDFRMLIRRKDHDLLAFILAKGANPNAMDVASEKNKPPLFEAYHQGDAEAMKIILRAGAVEKIMDDPDTQDFIKESADTAAFYSKCMSRKAYIGWLAKQSKDADVTDVKNMTAMRTEQHVFKKDGKEYPVKMIMCYALRGEFEKVIRLSLDTAEPLTAQDIYDEQTSAINLMDAMKAGGNNLFNPEFWQDKPQMMKRFYKLLEPYDAYRFEDEYKAAYQKLFNQDKMLERHLSRRSVRPPLKR